MSRIPVSVALDRIVQDGRNNGRDVQTRERTGRQITPGVEHERFVEVEYIGEPSFLRDPVVAFKLALTGQKGGFTSHQSAVIRASSRMRRTRSDAKVREVTERHGFSRTYRWSKKNNWIQRMTFEDATKLKNTPGGHHWIILGEEKRESPLFLPQNTIHVSSEVELREVTGYIPGSRRPSVRNG